jgi:WD40 repeat protein
MAELRQKKLNFRVVSEFFYEFKTTFDSLVLSRDGKYLAWRNGESYETNKRKLKKEDVFRITIFDLLQGVIVDEIERKDMVGYGGLYFYPDSRNLIIVNDKEKRGDLHTQIEYYDIITKKYLERFYDDDMTPTKVIVSPDGNLFYILRYTGIHKLDLMQKTNQQFSLEGKMPDDMKLSANGQIMVINNNDEELEVIQTPAMKHLKTIPIRNSRGGPMEDNLYYDVSPDGQFIFIFENDSGILKILNWSSNQYVKEMNLTNGEYGEITISPDGKLALIEIRSENDGYILVWDIFNSKYLGTIEGESIAVFGPQNTIITVSPKRIGIYQQ